jgi:UDP-N-acetylglucosamine acyltransferase
MSKIHPTAQIYPNVIIGENVEIGPYCIIGAPSEIKNGYPLENLGVIIGDNTIITGNVTIDGGSIEPTIIGKNCFIMKSVHVGHDCHIEDNVVLSAHSVLAGHVRICEHSNIGIGSLFHQFSLIGGGSMVGMGCVITKKSIVEPFSKMVGNPGKKIGENSYVINKLTTQDIDKIINNYSDNSEKGSFININN